MAISDSIFTPTLLGRTVTLTKVFAGFEFEHTGTVVAVLQVLEGSRAIPALLLDEGHAMDFHDQEDIRTIFIE